MIPIKAKYFITGMVPFLTIGCSLKQQDKQPNIIFVLADDLGYGDLSGFNPDGKIHTPNLDTMAIEGVAFTDAHTSSAVSTPTRYGILTGRYNWRSPLKSHVLRGHSDALIDTSRMTVASLLKENGYHTAYIGKWHLGWNWAKDDSGKIAFDKPVTHNPNDLGFDYAYGHCGSLDMAPYVYVENGMPTAVPDTVTQNTGKKFWRKGPTAPDFNHDSVTPNFFERSIAYIIDQSKKEQPYFLYLPLPSPHTPILPIGEWKGKSGINEYADFVMMIDHYMGLLLDAVQASGEANNTLVVFSSDNGCSPMANFGEMLEKGHDPSYIYRGHKSDIYEGGHRVPFIMKWPEKILAGQVSNTTICLNDFMATCADIINVTLPDSAGEDSYSLMPLVDSDSETEYKREATVHHSIRGKFAIRKGDWKLNFCPGSGGWSDPKPDVADTMDIPPLQLYNLADDPAEQNNLYDSMPDKIEELRTLMISILENGRSTPGARQANDSAMWSKWPGVDAIYGEDE